MFAFSVQFKGEVHDDNIWTPGTGDPRFLFVKPTAYTNRRIAERSMYLLEVLDLGQALELIESVKGEIYDPQVPQPRYEVSTIRDSVS